MAQLNEGESLSTHSATDSTVKALDVAKLLIPNFTYKSGTLRLTWPFVCFDLNFVQGPLAATLRQIQIDNLEFA